MLKNILNLKGAQQLSKKEQNAINGGAGSCGYATESLCNAACPSYPWECQHIYCGPNQGFPQEDGWECVDTSNPT
jgi:coenzyme F420-reducing hydrogenase gamma subunit